MRRPKRYRHYSDSYENVAHTDDAYGIGEPVCAALASRSSLVNDALLSTWSALAALGRARERSVLSARPDFERFDLQQHACR